MLRVAAAAGHLLPEYHNLLQEWAQLQGWSQKRCCTVTCGRCRGEWGAAGRDYCCVAEHRSPALTAFVGAKMVATSCWSASALLKAVPLPSSASADSSGVDCRHRHAGGHEKLTQGAQPWDLV
jgi:hypothetical protein